MKATPESLGGLSRQFRNPKFASLRSLTEYRGQFKSATEGSSGAPNAAVQLEQTRIFISIKFNF
jgi:hypothetical protein